MAEFMCTECNDEGHPEFIEIEETTWLEHHYQKHCKKTQECPCNYQYKEMIDIKELQDCGLTDRAETTGSL
jgi:hypothetical protein